MSGERVSQLLNRHSVEFWPELLENRDLPHRLIGWHLLEQAADGDGESLFLVALHPPRLGSNQLVHA